jgi:2-methylisocitrate lyase-like PEP mutase family enzyme
VGCGQRPPCGEGRFPGRRHVERRNHRDTWLPGQRLDAGGRGVRRRRTHRTQRFGSGDADIEAGYRLPAAELVERLLDAGAVGCNLEDTDHHGGTTGLLDADANADRLRAIRQAAHKAGVDIVLNARVDVLRQDGDRRELFEEAVRRARLYLQAGADCVFPIRLSEDALIGEFVERVEGPVNVVGAGAPPLARLAQLGVSRISFAAVLMNQLYGAHEAKLSAIAPDVAAIEAAGHRRALREKEE